MGSPGLRVIEGGGSSDDVGRVHAIDCAMDEDCVCGLADELSKEEEDEDES
jgi:hypothetical protein